tara:strand:+ start:4680 stop:7958 length:3279 start_codon:yes stop_codon:yes gene_type:complete
MPKNEKISPIIINDNEKIDTLKFAKKKIAFFKEMISKSTISIQRYKNMDIVTANELNKYTLVLESLYSDLSNLSIIISKKNIDFTDVINRLQKLNNELSSLFKSYGTSDFDDLITVALGSNFINNIKKKNKNIYSVIRKYVHPISYKVLPFKKKNNKDKKEKKEKKKNLAKNRIVEDFMIVEQSKNFDCFDLARTSTKFLKKVYGIKVVIHSTVENKIIIICGIIDDVVISCLNEPYIENNISELLKNRPKEPEFHTIDFDRFVETLTIKEFLIFNNKELYQKYTGYMSQISLLKQKPISQNVSEFVNDPLYAQRKTLIQLLIKYNDHEFQYLAYLLYDLLSGENNDKNIDTTEQTILFDSLPWEVKKYFREAMQSTIKYTQSLSNYDTSRIPIEQQICLMKAPDKVKEKAMIKLKEVKAKSEDSGSKAKQYLDGLLKIPFGIFKSEPILSNMKEIHVLFLELIAYIHDNSFTTSSKIPNKEKYSSLEIANYCSYIKTTMLPQIQGKIIKNIEMNFCKGKRDTLIANICFINGFAKRMSIKKLCHSGKKNAYMRDTIKKFLETHKNNNAIIKELQKRFPQIFKNDSEHFILQKLNDIEQSWTSVNNTMTTINDNLQNAVHGHDNAKRQIERIIGEWMNGEQSGYCFGFEGPPGVGKTSLAKKGLAQCLQDSDGKYRPFSFIAIGGSSNGSTLQGHNYTYVGSTWGRIVDILMETKCMNPIIFIDELDKVSKSEHGKELIGILTHLVDGTQNEAFQDKYFSGVDLDLSKALFIFSYNDAQLIDRILLDRIHRVKFDSLSVKDKLTITNKYLLPEIYKKIQLIDTIRFPDDVIQYIIKNYTYEAGVRKLKEILTEIIREINLEILTKKRSTEIIPIVITKDEICNKFLKNRHEIIPKLVHPKPAVGIINGLWANSLGKGGIIPIEACWSLANNPLDLKLTGLQGDVMKESMSVAKTLAWKLSKTKHNTLCKRFKKNKMQGIHVHCPEGATPKDGPSAGTAITTVIYSLFNSKKIKNNIAITGEINLQGRVTAIGGLNLKILGGIQAGVTEFIYPKENHKDFTLFMEKHEDKSLFENITFHEVVDIAEVLNLVFI